ncbi:hypothetical protein BTA51_23025 [Hahella sp. CCB-MM4]|uniref:type VI secretion system-associated FHA domain protein TagH n=1 Tax=Hahella sp. (strain CCB-MM4) TaxID=1926491 RepID=UPI000B9B58EC|nr:type VI secretion system-associated FHA domain protein TagH [Hahella sp. CCB-MM4]OZG70981.1 hypothetical protein BTA51_23025 [Hahella sp. CCB-MM4]
MQIKLKVVQCPPESGMTGKMLTVDESGATIGRAATNTFALPDVNRYVSSLHAKIQFTGQKFEIVDQSTNGTFLNNLSQALVKGQATPLSNGDQILMGPFVLEVVTDAGAASASGDADTTSVSATLSGYDSLSVPADSAGGLDDLDKWLEPDEPKAAPEPKPVIPDSAGADDSLISGDKELDPLAALGKGASDPMADLGLGIDSGIGAQDAPEGELPEGSLLSGGRMDVPGIIPDDWDKSLIQPAAPKRPSRPQPPTGKVPQPKVQLKQSEPPQKQKPSVKETGSLLDLVNTPEHELSSSPEPKPTSDSFFDTPAQSFDQSLDNPAQPGEDKLLVDEDKPAPIPPRDPLSDSLLESKFGAEIPSDETPVPGKSPWLQEQKDASMSGVQPKEEVVAQPPKEGLPKKEAPAKTEAGLDDLIGKPQKSQKEAPAEKSAPQESPKATASAKQAAMTPEQALNLAQALGLAGLSKEQLSQLTPIVAEVVRVSVEGLMQALRARQTIKNEFRMNLTMIQAAENNPLKFSLSPDDAIENLFAKQGKAYLSAIDATTEAFADISDHQLALFNGIRGAYDQLMNNFNPERLEKRFSRQRGKSLFGGSGKNWEAYQDYYEELSEDPEKTFRNLFGETFAEHYERSFNELKGKRRK